MFSAYLNLLTLSHPRPPLIPRRSQSACEQDSLLSIAFRPRPVAVAELLNSSLTPKKVADGQQRPSPPPAAAAVRPERISSLPTRRDPESFLATAFICALSDAGDDDMRLRARRQDKYFAASDKALDPVLIKWVLATGPVDLDRFLDGFCGEAGLRSLLNATAPGGPLEQAAAPAGQEEAAAPRQSGEEATYYHRKDAAELR